MPMCWSWRPVWACIVAGPTMRHMPRGGAWSGSHGPICAANLTVFGEKWGQYHFGL
ncbi:hypothetical protein Rmet_6438 [Cupriavidus metallidurans CH34]|uniref:Uncharacterized protein n=1 Tax=Cupriavidus metallidurans (strain ATCC 43123 / DSM 2839 / NBRC 102507 / CH34) TaxID=266264 RepID=D3DXN5_CUPMC|nr:hypothetical protein Rmet_6438 [Cupriavidus metallidurans CH34]